MRLNVTGAEMADMSKPQLFVYAQYLQDRAGKAELRCTTLNWALREAALLAHSFGGCITDFAHCTTATCMRYRELDPLPL